MEEINDNELKEVKTPPLEKIDQDLTGRVSISQDLQAKGANESGKMSGNPIGLHMWLYRIYNQSVSKISGINTQQEERINALKVKITGQENHIETLNQKIEDISDNLIPRKKEKIKSLEHEREDDISQKRDLINSLRVELEKIRGGDLNLIGAEVKAGDKIGFYIGIGILVCLTLYLVLFYTSVIYNAFILNVENESIAARLRDEIFTATIVNLEAIPKTWSTHGFLGTCFLLLATAVFLALGYLIHKFSQEKKYFFMTALYAFTFLFDALLAYEIVKKIYVAQYKSTPGLEPWEFGMFWSEVSFWIILFAGFLVYILWGVILSYSINESDKLQPSRMALNVRNEKIKQLTEGIEEDKSKFKNIIGSVKQELEELNDKVSNLKHEIQNNLTSIETHKKKIDTIKQTVEIPHSEVIDKLRTFTVGWTNHVNSAFIGNEKETLLLRCQKVIDDFITGMKPDNKVKPINEK